MSDENLAIVLAELSRRDMLIVEENGHYLITKRASSIMNEVMKAEGMQEAYDGLIADGCPPKIARLTLLLACAEYAFCGEKH